MLHLRHIKQNECFMVLLKCPIDGPSSASARCRKRSKTVDATHPCEGVMDECSVPLEPNPAIYAVGNGNLKIDVRSHLRHFTLIHLLSSSVGAADSRMS